MVGRGPSVFKIMDWIIMKNENYNYIDNVIDIAQVVGRGPSVGLDNIQNDGFDNSGMIMMMLLILPGWRDVALQYSR